MHAAQASGLRSPKLTDLQITIWETPLSQQRWLPILTVSCYHIYIFGKRLQQQRFFGLPTLHSWVYYYIIVYIILWLAYQQIFRLVISCGFGNVLERRGGGELRLDIGTESNKKCHAEKPLETRHFVHTYDASADDRTFKFSQNCERRRFSRPTTPIDTRQHRTLVHRCPLVSQLRR